ncbi:MAG: Na+/H+ antiporter NhaC [Actinomycetaceae bacterium]|nr:Na+/H+ antiporter NhaC [Actinomycetaceae bacterium]
MTSERLQDPPFIWAALTLSGVVGLISVGLLVFKADLHALMLGALILVAVSALTVARRSLPDIGQAIITGVWRARTALLIFILIGALIAALIQAGTVATLIYWGVKLIAPSWFLPTALILCSLMSIATGTAWGTAGTAGVILIGIGSAMGLPLPIVAGVVVSGACFGDKMSPVSDTTNLAAMAAETDLYKHIRSMAYTTGPAFLIALIAFGVAGHYYHTHALPESDLTTLTSAIHATYHVGWWTTVPLLVLIVMGILRVPAVYTMATSAVTAVITALIIQSASFDSVMRALWHGDTVDTGIASLDSLFARGGVTSMWFTLVLSVQALSLGGMLSHFGYMRIVIRGLLARVRRIGSLVAVTIIAALMGNLGMGEAYMSIVLGGQLFAEKYDEMGIDRAVLSRCLEEGATLTTPLIPWTTAGVFFASTLGVPTVDYVGYAWLNLMNPLIGMIFAYIGWGLLTTRKPVTLANQK